VLTDLDRREILALPYHMRRLEAQAYTMREGDRPDKCAILLSGYAFRHKLTGEGARQIMALTSPATRSTSRTCSSTNPTITSRC
jgi:CRP-like cAMP-binding protein